MKEEGKEKRASQPEMMKERKKRKREEHTHTHIYIYSHIPTYIPTYLDQHVHLAARSLNGQIPGLEGIDLLHSDRPLGGWEEREKGGQRYVA